MNKFFFGFLALAIVSAGLVYAHGGIGSYDFDMHDEVEDVLESGSYSDLEELREEYNLPMMHWIESEKDFEQAKSEPRGCHGWR